MALPLIPILLGGVLIGGIFFLLKDDKKPAKPQGRLPPAPLPGPSPAPSPSEPATNSGYPGITRQEMANIQQMLKANGYNPGKVDGIYGPSTKQAIMEFQTEMGLVPSGKPDADFLLILEEVNKSHPSQNGGFPGDPKLADGMVYNPGDWVTSLEPDQFARIELPDNILGAGEQYSWTVLDPDLVAVYDHEIGGTLYLDIYPVAEVSGTGTVTITVLGPDNQPVFEEDMVIDVNLV